MSEKSREIAGISLKTSRCSNGKLNSVWSMRRTSDSTFEELNGIENVGGSGGDGKSAEELSLSSTEIGSLDESVRGLAADERC